MSGLNTAQAPLVTNQRYLAQICDQNANPWFKQAEQKAAVYMKTKIQTDTNDRNLSLSYAGMTLRGITHLSTWVMPFPMNVLTNLSLLGELGYQKWHTYTYPPLSYENLRILRDTILEDINKMGDLEFQKQVGIIKGFNKALYQTFSPQKALGFSQLLAKYRCGQLLSLLSPITPNLLKGKSHKQRQPAPIQLIDILPPIFTHIESNPTKAVRAKRSGPAKMPKAACKSTINSKNAPSPRPSYGLRRVIYRDGHSAFSIEILQQALKYIPASFPQDFEENFKTGAFDKYLRIDDDFGGFKHLDESVLELKAFRHIGDRLYFKRQPHNITVTAFNPVNKNHETKSVPHFVFTGDVVGK